MHLSDRFDRLLTSNRNYASKGPRRYIKPFDDLDNVVVDLCSLKKLSNSSQVRHRALLRKWGKVYTLYAWLDPRNLGYIGIAATITWLQRLWQIKTRNCVSACPEQHTSFCSRTTAALTREPKASNCSLIDLLTTVLRDVLIISGSRSVIERNAFLWTIFQTLDGYRKPMSDRIAWLPVLMSEDPELNPLYVSKGELVSAPDIRIMGFFNQVIEPFPITHALRLYNEIDVAISDQAQRIAEKKRIAELEADVRLSIHSNAELLAHVMGSGTQYVVSPQNHENAGRFIHNDESVRFKFPLLDTTVNRVPAADFLDKQYEI